MIDGLPVELLRTLRMAGITRTWKEQGNVMTSQVGHYCKASYQADAVPDDEELLKVEARKALGDLTIQVMLSCAMLGIDFGDVIMEGKLSFQERMKQTYLRKRGEMKCPV